MVRALNRARARLGGALSPAQPNRKASIMSLFSGPQEHAQNAPETWRVVKRGSRYALVTGVGSVLSTCARKRDAEELLTSGPYFNLYRKESRWYVGETVEGWAPYRGSRA